LDSGLPSGIAAGTAATVFLDTYAQGLVPLEADIFILATRNNNRVYFSNLELSSGETSNIGSSIPQALLDYIGTPSENTANPDYKSAQVTTITVGDPTTIDDAEYFFISGGSTANRYYVWFDKSGSAVDPTPPSGTSGVEVDIQAAVTADDVAEALRLALDALPDFTATRITDTVTVTDTQTGPNQLPNNVNLGTPFDISAVVGSNQTVTDGTSLTQGIIDLDKGLTDVDNLLQQPIYEEEIQYPAGLPALTTIDLPANSRNFDKPLQIVSASAALEVYVNSRLVREPQEYVIVSENGGPNQEAQIRFNFDLPPDSTVLFRLDSLGGATSPVISVSAGQNWSDPVDASIIPDIDNTYDLGAPGLKFRDGYFAGKLTVDGVIDPTGLELVPQVSDPLAAGQAGIYIDDTGDLILRKTDDTTSNLIDRLDDLESGATNPIVDGNALTFTGVQLDVNVDDVGIEIDSDALRLKDLGVTTDKLADDAVTVAKILDAAVNEAKLNASVAGDGLSGGAGTPLSVNVDGSTLQIIGDVLSVVGADSLSIDAVAGESFSADTTVLVRFAVDGEDAGRVYRANSANAASDPRYLAIGVVQPTVAINAGDPIEVRVKGSRTLGTSDSNFAATDIGLPVFLSGAGTFSIAAPTSLGSAQYRIGVVEAVDRIFIDAKQLNGVVPEPVYDERVLLPTGALASTAQALPVNSRSGQAQTYTVGSGELKVFINQKLAFAGVEYTETSTSEITLSIDLPNDTEIHFRIEPASSGVLTGAGGGGGSQTLQDTYNLGSTITTSTGVPFTVNGPVGQKIAVFNGDIDVTGVIDPIALQLTPQLSNPLTPTQAGIFVLDGTNDLCFEDGQGGSKNITASITTLENASTTVTRLNNTGNTIPAFTPVYSPVAGEIAPADGTDDNAFRVIGITDAAIPDGDSGNVVSNGVLAGVIGYTHNSLIYLGSTIGTLTDDASSFPADFNIVRLGVMDGTNLFVQIQQMGSTSP
jgi:hypothetical protein